MEPDLLYAEPVPHPALWVSVVTEEFITEWVYGFLSNTSSV